MCVQYSFYLADTKKENIAAFVSITAQTICSYYNIGMILHFIVTTEITILSTDQKSEAPKYTFMTTYNNATIETIASLIKNTDQT